MAQTTQHRIDVRAGDQVLLGPAVGVHGWGEPWWAWVLNTREAMVTGFLYVRVVPVHDIDAKARTFYVQTRRLAVRRPG